MKNAARSGTPNGISSPPWNWEYVICKVTILILAVGVALSTRMDL